MPFGPSPRLPAGGGSGALAGAGGVVTAGLPVAQDAAGRQVIERRAGHGG
jgi:hypothetical protein